MLQALFKNKSNSTSSSKEQKLVEPDVSFWGDMSISTVDSLHNAKINGELDRAFSAIRRHTGRQPIKMLKPLTEADYKKLVKSKKVKIVRPLALD